MLSMPKPEACIASCFVATGEMTMNFRLGAATMSEMVLQMERSSAKGRSLSMTTTCGFARAIWPAMSSSFAA